MKHFNLILVITLAVISLLVFVFHRVIAKALRKFWAQCPKCGKGFGGHQRYAQHVTIDKNYRYVCPKCKNL